MVNGITATELAPTFKQLDQRTRKQYLEEMVKASEDAPSPFRLGTRNRSGSAADLLKGSLRGDSKKLSKAQAKERKIATSNEKMKAKERKLSSVVASSSQSVMYA